MEEAVETIVAGAGPAGALAALALAHEGFEVVLVGPVPAADRRTSAVMVPGLEHLERFGLADKLKREGAPLRAMRIVDATRRLLRSPPVTFRASEIGEEAFGWNIPNAGLNAVLADAVDAEPRIRRITESVTHWVSDETGVTAALSSGSALRAKLAVAADGRSSPAREAAGIEVLRRKLPQSALVVNFRHSRDHGFVSTEFHTETGPFTQVPLPGQRSSLVWVVRPEEASALAGLDDFELSRRIETRMQSCLGAVEVEPGRQVYPLASALPRRFAAKRTALVGEAAHLFPPIGAQGLNLGIRDVRDLAEAAARDRTDPGSTSVLDSFDRKRRTDVVARSAGVELLNQSLLSSALPVQLGRGLALTALERIPRLRGALMRSWLGRSPVALVSGK
ncbi:MAG: UbiH/UbiF family hydroxylase [Mesorhizobium amorphae]|nr:MAG: UbiH/UbiF family hydroxylase [Mesorhizobium amorphae]